MADSPSGVGARAPVLREQLTGWAARLVRLVCFADLSRNIEEEVSEPVRLVALEMKHAAEALPPVGARAPHITATVDESRCEGVYPVPHKRDEPFVVTYRCALPRGHEGPHGSGNSPEPMVAESVDRPEPIVGARVPIEPLEPPAHIVELAVQVSTWSPCRSKRGVVIFSGEDVLSYGYNHKPIGFDCDGSEACKATCRREAVHAEQHALLNLRSPSSCEALHVKTVDGALVPSGGPSCVECSKLLLAARVRAVWLYHEQGWRRYGSATFHALSLDALLRSAREQTPERRAEETEDQSRIAQTRDASTPDATAGKD